MNVQPEICQSIKNMPKTITQGSEKYNLFFTAFTFLNPESINYIMSYMESSDLECPQNFVLLTHSYFVWSIIHLLLLNFKNIRKNISRLKLSIR